jgi:OmcA/MtrC family decaheme c-type cytochrome
VLCHNPTQTDEDERLPEALPGESVNLKQMIHKIHTGAELDPDAPFVVAGHNNSINDFSEVLFPGDRRVCTICHIDGTQQLPLQKGLLSTNTPYDFLSPQPPISGACLSCHNSLPAAAHANLNISPTLGEACEVCHKPGADFSVDRMHAQ